MGDINETIIKVLVANESRVEFAVVNPHIAAFLDLQTISVVGFHEGRNDVSQNQVTLLAEMKTDALKP